MAKLSAPSFAPSPASRRARAGFSLVEVSLALGIVSFCIVALLGLFLTALNGEQSASDQAVAMEVISALASDIKTSQATNTGGQTPNTNKYGIQFPNLGQSPVTNTLWIGDNLETVPSGSGAMAKRYAVTYTAIAPATRYGSFQVFVRVMKGSKAQTAAAGLVQTSFTESVISKSVQ